MNKEKYRMVATDLLLDIESIERKLLKNPENEEYKILLNKLKEEYKQSRRDFAKNTYQERKDNMFDYKKRDELLIRLNLTRDPDETLDFSQELEEMYKDVPLETMCKDFVETDDVYLNRMLRLNIIKQLMKNEKNIEEFMGNDENMEELMKTEENIGESIIAVYRKVATLKHLDGNPRAYKFAVRRLKEMNYEIESYER